MRIWVVIPAHDEEATIAKCLISVQTAIRQLPPGITAYPLVVLDSCTDGTLPLVRAAGVDFLCCGYQCVGQARNMGIRHAIAQGATWLACTDADSVVAPDWLSQQIDHITDQAADVICGVVSIDNWTGLTSRTRESYLAHYHDMMGHRHIHGANLCFSRVAYIAVGGFSPLASHEDVNLVMRFWSHGYSIAWSNRVRVVTSSRLKGRAIDGFASFLAQLEIGY